MSDKTSHESGDGTSTLVESVDGEIPSRLAIPRSDSSFNVLRRFVRSRAATEHCDLCSVAIASNHPHLIEPSTRQIICACQACAILFSGQAERRYRRIPQRVCFLDDFQLTDAQWDALMIPIGMAFFFRNSVGGRVMSIYPSPAGPTESSLDLESWDEIVRNNPVLDEMEVDTEALLVNRLGDASEYYLLPIDECYRLVGLIRTNWRGLSGGADVWEAIGKFFAGVKEKAVPEKGVAHA